MFSFAAYWRRFARTGDRAFPWYLAAFIVCVFSEMTFTLYRSAYDTYNLLGHIYKIAAFCMIYQGVFSSSVTHPYVQLVDADEKLRVAMAGASTPIAISRRAKTGTGVSPRASGIISIRCASKTAAQYRRPKARPVRP